MCFALFSSDTLHNTCLMLNAYNLLNKCLVFRLNEIFGCSFTEMWFRDGNISLISYKNIYIYRGRGQITTDSDTVPFIVTFSTCMLFSAEVTYIFTCQETLTPPLLLNIPCYGLSGWEWTQLSVFKNDRGFGPKHRQYWQRRNGEKFCSSSENLYL